MRGVVLLTHQQRNGLNKMTNLNTQANRTTVLNRIEKDGVNLSEFNESQQSDLIV